MSINTEISWCDSSVNPVMGCDGCELWSETVQACYAGTLSEKRAGQKGFPKDFNHAEMFPDRMMKASRWPDLRGAQRKAKPWIPRELPRLVFISDMGDALSKNIPFGWLKTEIVDTVSTWPHIGLWLTKQPKRMMEFDRWLADNGIAWPDNLWAGTSVTTQPTCKRIDYLLRVRAKVKFVSAEPLLEHVNIEQYLLSDYDKAGADNQFITPLQGFNYSKVHWVIVGLESGSNRRDPGVGVITDNWDAPKPGIVVQCDEHGTPLFVKQDSAFKPGQQGRIPDEIWNRKEFPKT